MWTYPRSGLTRWRGRGIELTDGPNKGRILIPGHHFDVKSQEPDNNTHCHVLMSDNGGKNWTFGGRTRGFSFEGNLVELDKGRFAFHTPTSRTHSDTMPAINRSPLAAVAGRGSPKTPERLKALSFIGSRPNVSGKSGYSGAALSIATVSGASASIIEVSTSSAW